MDFVKEATKQLKARAKPGRAEFEKNYHKSDLKFLGSPIPAQAKVAKGIAKQIKGCTRVELLDLAQEMWDSGVHDLHGVAIDLLCLNSELLSKRDLPMLKRWVIESNGWAHVDSISAHLLSRLISADPTILNTMDKWAAHKNIWVRRAAMLSLLLPLRSGDLGEWDRFCRYAEPQLEEKEFFIRKAIGWVLRETSKKNPSVVRKFIQEHQDQMSGLTIREGSKYL